MNATEIENRLETFQKAVETSRKSLGVIGGDSTGGPVPDTIDLRKELMNALTAAAATNSIRFIGSDSVTVDRVLRIEHQTWIRGKTENGIECVNLLEYNTVELV